LKQLKNLCGKSWNNWNFFK